MRKLIKDYCSDFVGDKIEKELYYLLSKVSSENNEKDLMKKYILIKKLYEIFKNQINESEKMILLLLIFLVYHQKK